MFLNLINNCTVQRKIIWVKDSIKVKQDLSLNFKYVAAQQEQDLIF